MQESVRILTIGLIIVLTICLIIRLYNVGRVLRNERISYEYIDRYNLIDKRLSFKVNKKTPLKGRYIQLYGTVNAPLEITEIKVNDVFFPYKAFGTVPHIILENTPENTYKLVTFDLSSEYEIKKIDIKVNPKTTKSLKSFKILVRDYRGSKVWESADFLKTQEKNVFFIN